MLSSIGCNRPSGCTQPHLNRFSFCPPPFALENMKSYFMLMLIFIVFRLSLLTLLCNLCFSLGMFDVFDLWFWECSLVFFFVGELHTIYENWTHPLLVFLRLGTPFSTECRTHGFGRGGGWGHFTQNSDNWLCFSWSGAGNQSGLICETQLDGKAFD